MRRFGIACAAVGALLLLVGCEDKTTTVIKKDGAVNPGVCSGSAPFIIRTQTDGVDAIHCLNEADFTKYKVGDKYP